MPDTLYYVTAAFMVGLLGGAHCVGMCGGIMNALVFAVPENMRSTRKVLPIVLLYNLGRITSYALAGFIIGWLGSWMQFIASPSGIALRILAGVMMIAMGLYIAGWWKGLSHLEKVGGVFWKYLQPIGNRFMPVTRAWQALFLGMVWGWLPCGMVYSALTLSAGVSYGPESALVMIAFGLGTLPVMVLTGAFANKVKAVVQKAAVRNVAALLVIGFGVWTLATPLSHLTSSGHGGHDDAAAQTPSNAPVDGAAEAMPKGMHSHH